jgi:hypothetical protein
MSHPLDGCWAKIERANENIKNLGSEIAAFTHTENYLIIRNIDHKAKECTFSALGQLIPLRFSVLAGEIIHHLRSSLDHLVWALVLQRHATPTFKVQFPLYTIEKEFKAAKKGGIIKGISGSAQAIIERIQPYREGSFGRSPSDHPLRILHDLNIADKHTLLAVAVSAAFIPSKLQFSGKMADNQIERIIPEQWADLLLRAEPGGTKILTIKFTKMHPEVLVKANFRYEVAFEQFGTREVEPVIPSLIHLRDYVTKTIKLFDREFR